MPRSSPRPNHNLNSQISLGSPSQGSPSTPNSKKPLSSGTPPSKRPPNFRSSPIPSTATASSSSPAHSDPSIKPESSLQAQVRSLLADHYRARKAWHRLVLVQGSQLGNNIISIKEEVAQTAKHKGKRKQEDETDAQILYLVKKISTLEDIYDSLANTILQIRQELNRMNEVSNKLHQLLLDHSASNGIESSFREPLWTTRPLSGFVTAIEDLTHHYTTSLHLMQECFTTLTTHSTQISEAQAALSYWVCQPFLPRSQSPSSSKWFNDVCEVEIPNWSRVKSSIPSMER